MTISIAGMIGLGKTTLAESLAQKLNSKVLYESIGLEENPILPLFYTYPEERLLEERLSFLLQLHFLHTRSDNLRLAAQQPLNIVDRSLEEDEYFAYINHKLGRINELEFNSYKKLKRTITTSFEDSGVLDKDKDIYIYLKASFETVMNRIRLRGRDFEQSEDQIDYFKMLWSNYDEWALKTFEKKNLIIIDMDKFDIVKNKQDEIKVLYQITSKINTIFNKNII